MAVLGVGWPIETFLERLFVGLADGGVDVWVAARDRAPWVHAADHPRLHWLRLPTGTESRSRRGLQLVSQVASGLATAPRSTAAALRASGSMAEALRLLPYARRPWDLFYFPWNAAAMIHLPLYDLGVPVLVSCRGAQINVAAHDPSRRRLYERLPASLTGATAVHCVSRDMVREAELYGLDPAKARVIPPSVDPEVFAPPPGGRTPRGPGEPLRLVTTGSMIWRKGHDDAIHAVALARERGVDVELDIVGFGFEGQRQRLLYGISDLGLEGKVRLVGHLAPEGVRGVLQRAHGFLLASLSEGISNAALEAMACGLPVISTDCGGMPEAITDGVHGLLVPTRDPEALADAIARLAADGEGAAAMGTAARRRVAEDFRLDRQIADFLDLVRRTADC